MSITQQEVVNNTTGNVVTNQLDNISRLERIHCLLEQSNKLMEIVLDNKKEIKTLREQIGE